MRPFPPTAQGPRTGRTCLLRTMAAIRSRMRQRQKRFFAVALHRQHLNVWQVLMGTIQAENGGFVSVSRLTEPETFLWQKSTTLPASAKALSVRKICHPFIANAGRLDRQN